MTLLFVSNLGFAWGAIGTVGAQIPKIYPVDVVRPLSGARPA